MSEDKDIKKPRLFYREDACDCWTPVTEKVEDMISLDLFEDGEEIEYRFRRFDMTDQEFADIPLD